MYEVCDVTELATSSTDADVMRGVEQRSSRSASARTRGDRVCSETQAIRRSMETTALVERFWAPLLVVATEAISVNRRYSHWSARTLSPEGLGLSADAAVALLAASRALEKSAAKTVLCSVSE